MISYRFANARDMESIIDFINMVFSMLRMPHDFPVMLPKAYSKELSRPEIHAIAEENGHICGCLGMLEFPLTICGEELRVGYLGSMSVHPRVRGQGIMGELMRRQILRGREYDLDMMVLGGQRQRYQYSDFETCGASYRYSISKANVRHAYAGVDASRIEFKEMREAAEAFALYEGQNVSGARTEADFIPALRSYGNCGWMILSNGRFIGYICVSHDGQHISELVLKDKEDIPAVVKAWSAKQGGKQLYIHAAPYDAALNSALSPICEGFSLTPNCMLRILNPERVIQSYMKLKNTYESLGRGSLILRIEGLKTIRILVSDDGISVQKTDEKPDLVLTERQAVQLLFDYNPFTLPEVRKATPDGWFPLPFHISEPDSF